MNTSNKGADDYVPLPTSLYSWNRSDDMGIHLGNLFPDSDLGICLWYGPWLGFQQRLLKKIKKSIDKIANLWYTIYVIKRAVALRNGDN